MSQHPVLKWAQRKDRLLITVDVRDCENEEVDLKEDSFKFKGKSANKQYECEIELLDQVDVEQSKWNKTGLMVQIILFKKNTEAGFWKRLTKQDQKNNFIVVDWSKYVDEDEEEEEGQKGLGQDWDPSMMQNFNPGMEGADDDSDDDDDQQLDDLDQEQKQEDKQEEKQEDKQE